MAKSKEARPTIVHPRAPGFGSTKGHRGHYVLSSNGHQWPLCRSRDLALDMAATILLGVDDYEPAIITDGAESWRGRAGDVYELGHRFTWEPATLEEGAGFGTCPR